MVSSPSIYVLNLFFFGADITQMLSMKSLNPNQTNGFELTNCQQQVSLFVSGFMFLGFFFSIFYILDIILVQKYLRGNSQIESKRA